MCPHCGEHLERVGNFNVWLCPVCDYGETDELRQQRRDEEEARDRDAPDDDWEEPEPDPGDAPETGRQPILNTAQRERVERAWEPFTGDEPLLQFDVVTTDHIGQDTIIATNTGGLTEFHVEM